MSADFDDGVEFLDLDGDGADRGAADDGVDWLDEDDDEERVASGRDPQRLPRVPPATGCSPRCCRWRWY